MGNDDDDDDDDNDDDDDVKTLLMYTAFGSTVLATPAISVAYCRHINFLPFCYVHFCDRKQNLDPSPPSESRMTSRTPFSERPTYLAESVFPRKSIGFNLAR